MRKSKFLSTLIIFMLLALVAISCETTNSNTSDELFYDNVVNISDSSLIEPYAILKKECMSCHNRHQEWLYYGSNQDWIDAGLIIPGNPGGSLLIQRMQNTSSSESSLETNMPLEGSVIDANDYQALRDWIQSP